MVLFHYKHITFQIVAAGLQIKNQFKTNTSALSLSELNIN